MAAAALAAQLRGVKGRDRDLLLRLEDKLTHVINTPE
jgi:hypothetical protein